MTDSSFKWQPNPDNPTADGCAILPPGVPKISDVVSNIGSMLQNSGAGNVCKQAMKTYAQAMTASFEADQSIPFASAKEKAAAAVQNSGTDMSQSGCGTYIESATDNATQAYQMQCIIQACTKTNDVQQVAVNSISISTLPLTEDETLESAGSLVKAQENQASAISNLTSIIKNHPELTDKITALLSNKIFLDSFTDPVKQLYNRDIDLNKVNFKQTMKLKSGTTVNLSTEDQSNLASLAKNVATNVAENDAKEKLGTGALAPNVKQALDEHIQNAYANTQKNVNSKVSSVTSSVDGKNTLTITAPGNITLDTVNFDQNFESAIRANILMNDAISTGLSASSEAVTKAITDNTADLTSKGADDLVAALGKANADALKAEGIQSSPIATIIGVIIGLIALFFIARHFMSKNKNK